MGHLVVTRTLYSNSNSLSWLDSELKNLKFEQALVMVLQSPC